MHWLVVGGALGLAGYVSFRVYRAMFQNWRGRQARLSRRDIIDFMNYAVALELEQVEFYRVHEREAERRKRPHLAAGMRQARRVEARHARNLKAEIARLGGKTSPLTGMAAPIGRATGKGIGGLGGEELVLRSMVGIEQKAIDHYLRVIHQLDDRHLKRLFMEHLVDEEFHAAWAQEMLEQACHPSEKDQLRP